MSSTKVPIAEGLGALTQWLVERGAEHVMVITTGRRRFVERLDLGRFDVTVFDGAELHVPRAVVERASKALTDSGADTIVSLGGGSSTGLGKALRLTHDVRFAAVPTTYAASEMTRIFGVREDGEKRTGRDDRVRPDVVVHAPSLFAEMALARSTTSLLNAFAHPVSALAEGALEPPVRADALRAIARLSSALDLLLELPASRDGRRAALEGAALAGGVLDRAKLGAHHRAAHLLGGRFGLDHGGLHSVLLPHFVRHLAIESPDLYAEISEAAGYPDLPAVLYDALTRSGAKRSVAELGVEHGALAAARADEEGLRQSWVDDATLGRRPSIHTRRWDAATSVSSSASSKDGSRPSTSVVGPELALAERVVIAVHGRGANADRMIKDTLDLVGHAPGTTIVAPQAPQNSWYPLGYRAGLAEHGADLDGAIGAIDAEIERVRKEVPAGKVFLAGFSQGACLAAEAFARRGEALAGLVALAGARIGPLETQPPPRAVDGARVVLGVATADRWVDAADVAQTAAQLEEAGARVDLVPSPGESHAISPRQRLLAREALLGRSVRDGQSGFGNAHETEALPGALPRHQNTPRRGPYGLFPEQINATGFVAKRAHNRRSWLYRIRPSARHTPFVPLAHPTLRADWNDEIEPNLCGWTPIPMPSEPTDFVDGLATFGGAGHPSLRRGCAIHLYVANRSMADRTFYDADGELLIVPQEGALTIQTELGVLDVAPGQIAVVPRGLWFSVYLVDGAARGYVAEVYGRSFELPERGPVGANGLTDARHFHAPSAYFEDRLRPGYRVTAKLGNRLFDATQDYSPYDVVAWHGNYAPHVYDLDDFSPVGNTRIDHPDPSIYCVIGAPLDEAGASSLDLVFFPPRWDPTEHTFRPPFFHRNAVTEFNGIIADPTLRADGPFVAGGYFMTPCMTAHGVLRAGVERALRLDDAVADQPRRTSDHSKWFQLETVLPIALTSWAKTSANRDRSWPDVWGAYRPHFDPRSGS